MKKCPSASRVPMSPRVVPALAQRLGRGLRIAPVLEEHVGAAHDDLAVPAGGDLAAGVVDDLRLAHQARQARRARAAPVAGEARVDGDGARLGRAVDLQHRHVALGEGIDQALRHLRRAGGHAAQAVERGLLPARMLDHGLDGGRHQHGQRRPVARDRLQRRLGRKARVQRDGGAQLQRRRGLDVEPADVEHRQHGQHVVGGRHVVHVLAHHRVPHQRLLAQHGALGVSGGAGGVDDEQRERGVDVRAAPIAAGAFEQCRQRAPPVGREVQADDAHVGQRLGQRRDDGRKGLLDDKRPSPTRRRGCRPAPARQAAS